VKVLITGAAGFIGSHAAARFLKTGAAVVGLDNLSRKGAFQNLEWLQAQGGALSFRHADIRSSSDIDAVFRAHPDVDLVLHAAGQVAVTTSVVDPRLDFEANALGTFNMLEATRQFAPNAAFFFTSTNKVYGALSSLDVVERDGRYAFATAINGVSEQQPLDLHSPYGCSKGAADQYVHDYGRIYGLRTVVVRQSCIYGTRQFGVEDQGWVAWFVIGSVLGKQLSIYGDGKQVRDLLWIDDLCDLYVTAYEQIGTAAGQIYNAGGGPDNVLSLLELVALLRERLGDSVSPRMADWRPGDQPVFVADIRKVKAELGWEPRVSTTQGVDRLLEWAQGSQDLLRTVLS
jgi:CDP-paratose 2-epimerase